MSASVQAERPLTSQWPIFGGEELENLRLVLRSGHWGHTARSGYVGAFEPEFERTFADYHGARHGVCLSNGTVALQLALEALDIGAGDEVIVPGLTWQATAAAVLDVNGIPVLVDVEPDTYCIDPAAVEAAITPHTRAVIAVHLYNSLADLDRLATMCERHNLYLIEDCAHSHGSQWNARGVGSIGAVGCFSFQLTKSLTCGEGGFCTTNSDKLRDRLDALRNCGRPPAGVPDDWPAIQSGNYRLSEWQAAVLCAQFARFPEQLARRAANAQRLNDALEDVAGMRPMRRPPQVTRQGLYAYVIRYDGHAFAGLLASEFRHALSAELGIDVGSTYEPLNRSPLYQPQTKRRHQLGDQWAQLDPARFDLPIATRAYESESVVIPHEVLLAGWDDLSRLPNAIETVRDRAVHDGESRG